MCLYLFPLLMLRADPACRLILTKLDWCHLAIFHHLMASSSKAYRITGTLLAECVQASWHLPFNWILAGFNLTKIAAEARANPHFLLQLVTRASQLSHFTCLTCVNEPLHVIYPLLACGRNAKLAQVEFNPSREDVVTVVFVDNKPGAHVLITYKLKSGKAVADVLGVYKGQSCYDIENHCKLKSATPNVVKFMSASWSGDGSLLAVYESKNRFDLACGVRITLFALKDENLTRLDCRLPELSRLNLIQRPRAFKLQLWSSSSNSLVISEQNEFERTVIAKIGFVSTTDEFAKVELHPVQNERMLPACEPGYLGGSDCGTRSLERNYQTTSSFTPYGYWLINDYYLITCERCSVSCHLDRHCSIMMRQLNESSASSELADTIIFSKHRVHDGIKCSKDDSRLLLLLGSSDKNSPVVPFTSNSWRKLQVFGKYRYRCPLDAPWLGKSSPKADALFTLIAVTVPNLTVEVLCQDLVVVGRQANESKHTRTMTIMGQSTVCVVVQECCSPCETSATAQAFSPLPRYYIFSKLGNAVIELTEDVYIPSPYSYLSFKIDTSGYRQRNPSAEPQSEFFVTKSNVPLQSDCCRHRGDQDHTCALCRYKSTDKEFENSSYPAVQCMVVNKLC